MTFRSAAGAPPHPWGGIKTLNQEPPVREAGFAGRLRELAARLAGTVIADDPIPGALTGLDILHIYGEDVYAKWVATGTPIVTPADMTAFIDQEVGITSDEPA